MYESPWKGMSGYNNPIVAAIPEDELIQPENRGLKRKRLREYNLNVAKTVNSSIISPNKLF